MTRNAPEAFRLKQPRSRLEMSIELANAPVIWFGISCFTTSTGFPIFHEANDRTTKEKSSSNNFRIARAKPFHEANDCTGYVADYEDANARVQQPGPAPGEMMIAIPRSKRFPDRNIRLSEKQQGDKHDRRADKFGDSVWLNLKNQCVVHFGICADFKRWNDFRHCAETLPLKIPACQVTVLRRTKKASATRRTGGNDCNRDPHRGAAAH
jgi:hypothetical protein